VTDADLMVMVASIFPCVTGVNPFGALGAKR